MITLGFSSLVMVSAHESHDSRASSIQSTVTAVSHKVGEERTSANKSGVGESMHGHTHDEFSHDHTFEAHGGQANQFAHKALTAAPDDCAPSVCAPPVFEIDIPPRG